MSIKAKFKCVSVTDFGTQKKVTMQAVYGKEGENADFSKYTPSGNFDLTVNEDTKAFNAFEPQKEYYLNIEEA